MDNPITRKSWSPYVVGAAIGVLSWFAFATADKPLGITTAFENSAALVEKAAIPDFEQTNEYYAAKANEGKSPKIDWEWMLVLGVFIGALLSATLGGIPFPGRRDHCGWKANKRLFGSNEVLFQGSLHMAHDKHASCIEACVKCAQECEHCADACLGEQDVKMMAECIRLDRDCAEICWAAAGWMSRGSQFAADLCRLCAEVCDACGAECKKHKHDHCQRCAEACRRCAEECRKMAGV